MKKFLSAFMTLAILAVSVLPSFAITPLETDLIKTEAASSFEKETVDDVAIFYSGIDIKEKVDNRWISSTFSNRGYHIFLNVDKLSFDEHGLVAGSDMVPVLAPINYDCEDTAPVEQTINGLKLAVEITEENGHAIMKYTVKNPSTEAKTFSLGVGADVEVDNDDSAEIKLYDNGKTIKMVNDNSNAAERIAFTITFDQSSPIDTTYIGHWDGGDYLANLFKASEPDASIKNMDSAVCFSWKDKTIQPGGTMVFKNNLEVSKNYAPVVTIDEVTVDSNKLNIKVQDRNLDIVDIFMSVDGADFTKIDSFTSDGSEINFEYSDFDGFACGSTHTLKFYATDIMGAQSETSTIEYTVAHKWMETGRDESTCSVNGVVHYECEKCHETKDETLPLVAHNFGEWEVTTEPKCMEAGEKTRICSVCTHEEKEPVFPLGHDFGEWTVDTEPTCTEEGKEVRGCSRCEATEERAIAALGHDWETAWDWADDYSSATCTLTCKNNAEHIETKTDNAPTTAADPDATCTAKGIAYHTAKVVVDGKEYSSTVTNEIEMKEHDILDWEITKEPTCTEKGLRVKKCKNCDYIAQSEELDALGHDYEVEYKWAEDNKTCTATATCKRDKTHIVTETVNVAESIETAATCTTTGVMKYTAKFENKLFAEQTVFTDIEVSAHLDRDKDNICDICGKEIGKNDKVEDPTIDGPQEDDPQNNGDKSKNPDNKDNSKVKQDVDIPHTGSSAMAGIVAALVCAVGWTAIAGLKIAEYKDKKKKSDEDADA